MPYTTVNGVKLYYEDTGKGKPIVFLHGYVGDMEDWRNQINLLSPKYRCLAIDQRGRGKAEAPKKPEQYSMELFIDDVYKWLKQLKIDKMTLVGHSLGGRIALGFVLDHPEMVENLVITDATGNTMLPDARGLEYRNRLHEVALKQGTLAAFEYDFANNPATHKRYTAHPETMDRMREKTKNTSPEGYVYVCRVSDNRAFIEDRYPEIKCPTLIVCGTDDQPHFINGVKAIKAGVPGSELVWVQNAGHGPMYEKPEEYNPVLLKFLDRVKY